MLRTLVLTLGDFIALNDRAWDWRASQGVLTPLTEPDEDLSILLAGSGQPRSPSDLPTSIVGFGQAHDFSRGWLTLVCLPFHHSDIWCLEEESNLHRVAPATA